MSENITIAGYVATRSNHGIVIAISTAMKTWSIVVVEVSMALTGVLMIGLMFVVSFL